MHRCDVGRRLLVPCRARARRKRRYSMKMPSLLEISRRMGKVAVGSTGSTVSLDRRYGPHTPNGSVALGLERHRRSCPQQVIRTVVLTHVLAMIFPGACNHCRRMKMRCVGADDPPCKRCRVTGEDCVMEKPRKGTSSLDAPAGDELVLPSISCTGSQFSDYRIELTAP